MPVMRVAAQYVLLLMLAFSPVLPVAAYGPTGHRVVGKIAAANICAAATAQVDRLLAGESLARAGQWPDWIRREPQWRHSRPWHYINVADNGRLEDVTGGDGGDVIWAIERFSAELADSSLSDERRARALRFLTHFIADVHQPLHVGRAADRGGNQLKIRVAGKASNLHQFWDAQYLLKVDRQANGYDEAGQIQAISRLHAPSVSETPVATVFDWARESQALRAQVYRNGAQMPVDVDAAYTELALRISRERLAAAGFRLAGRLNDIFCFAPSASAR